jgi:hypothetical protein
MAQSSFLLSDPHTERVSQSLDPAGNSSVANAYADDPI